MADKDLQEVDIPNYSLEQLGRDFFSQYSAEAQTDIDEKKRDKLLKLKVLFHLLSIAMSVADTQKEEERLDAIRSKFADDDTLFAYTCFLASNAQYDYSWNYQRKQWDKYIDVLGYVSSFFTKMLSCINMLQTGNYSIENGTFVFANLFIVTLDRTTGKAKAKVNWENIEQLFCVRKGYTISAQLDQVILLSSFCGYKGNDFDKFLENLSKLKIEKSKNV